MGSGGSALLPTHPCGEGRLAVRLVPDRRAGPAAITNDLSTIAPLIQGYALYQQISEEEAHRWMLLGSADDVCRQIDAFVAAGISHFVLTLSPYNFDFFERFASDALPRHR